MQTLEEVWVYVREFPTYMVSNLGNVKHARIDRYVRPQADRYGYLRVRLYAQHNGQFWYYVDEMVAKHFLPDYVEGCRIDHIDGDVQYNAAHNLRCVVEEVWKVIPEFPTYEVSSQIRVRRARSGRVLRPDITGSVVLTNGSFEGRRSVNKLFREAFGR
jgi:hypothetical protein